MKEKDLDKDTIVAYHAYLQTRIHNELNATGLGPARFPWLLAQILAVFSFLSGIVGIIVITVRHRHVYLVDWWHAFLGPFFIVLALILATLATYMIVIAKRRSNAYRRELFFRPIGDYGVAVVHKSTLMHDEEHRSDLKSGTAPHRSVLPHAAAYGHEKNGHENRAYNDNGYNDQHHKRRPDDRDRRRPDDRDRRRPDDREKRRPDDKDRRHPDDRNRDRRRPDDRDRDRRRPDDRDRRRPEDRDRDRRRPEDRDRDRRRPEDRERRPPDDRRDDQRRPPNIPRDEKDERTGERRPPQDDDREPRRTDEHEPPSGSSHGGRRAVRGIPKIAVTEGSQSSPIVLDADFGQPAGYGQGESEL